MPPKSQYNDQVTFNLPAPQKMNLEQIAAEIGVKPAVICRWALTEYLKAHYPALSQEPAEAEKEPAAKPA